MFNEGETNIFKDRQQSIRPILVLTVHINDIYWLQADFMGYLMV